MDNVTRRKGGRVGRDNIEGANDKGEREGGTTSPNQSVMQI